MYHATSRNRSTTFVVRVLMMGAFFVALFSYRAYAQGSPNFVVIDGPQSVSIVNNLRKGDHVKIHIDYTSSDPDDPIEGEPLIIENASGNIWQYPVPTQTDITYIATQDGDALGGFIFGGDFDESAVLTVIVERLKIIRVNTSYTDGSGKLHSFISTDKLQLQAVTDPGVDVEWTVEGAGAATGINGFPKDKKHTADASGMSSFSFSPADNQDFLDDRNTNWTKGSKTQRNTTLAFDVVARATINGEVFESRFSSEGLGSIEQDETDILRQEYVDYSFNERNLVPERGDFVPSLGRPWNNGPYSVQLDMGLKDYYNSIVAAYRALSVTIDGKTVHIPNTASVDITVGYRNPQYNRAIGSIVPISGHTLGCALDLQTSPMIVVVNRKVITLTPAGQLNQALFDAANSLGFALAEFNSRPTTPAKANHIHADTRCHIDDDL